LDSKQPENASYICLTMLAGSPLQFGAILALFCADL